MITPKLQINEQFAPALLLLLLHCYCYFAQEGTVFYHITNFLLKIRALFKKLGSWNVLNII
jgi:hypothetical protein